VEDVFAGGGGKMVELPGGGGSNICPLSLSPPAPAPKPLPPGRVELLSPGFFFEFLSKKDE